VIGLANSLPRAVSYGFPIHALEAGVVKVLLNVLGYNIHDAFHAPAFELVVSLHAKNSAGPPGDRQSYERNQCLPYEEAALEHDSLPQWKLFIMSPVSGVEQRQKGHAGGNSRAVEVLPIPGFWFGWSHLGD